MDVIEIHIVVIFGLLFMVIILAFLVYIVYSYRKKQIRFERELLTSRIEIQEEIFTNISQEIHDNVGQVLTVAKMQLNFALKSMPVVKEADLLEIKDNLSKAISDLRDVSKGLNTDYLTERTFLGILSEQVERINKLNTAKATLTISGDPVTVEPEKKLILFRIFQECIHNILKHARATNIDVCVQHAGEAWSMTIADDGCGFVPLHHGEHSGLGLKNIYSRAHLIGAKVNVSSEISKGTAITLTLPV
jgi:two-component system, NarL family, sensor kinase